jgi:hypothetical protein
MSSTHPLTPDIIPGTYVIRDGDAPSLAMVCVVTTVMPTWILAPYLRDLPELRPYAGNVLQRRFLTPVTAFGRQVTADLRSGMAMAEASSGLPASAADAGGRPRPWRDSLSLPRLISIAPPVLGWLRTRAGATA